MSIIARSISSIGYSQGPRSVSSVGYLANQQDGRSGYWRLFYTQLQEQSLAKVEKPAEKPVVYPAVKELPGGAAEVEIPQEKSKKPKVAVEKPLEPEEPPRQYTPVPPYKKAEEVPNYGQMSWILSMQIQSLVFSYTRNQVKFNLDTDAANDESDVEFLLLVA